MSQLISIGVVQKSWMRFLMRSRRGWGLISSNRETVKRYFHFDGLGNTVALTDSIGDVQDTYVWTAFGVLLSSTGSSVNPYRYVGQWGYYDDGAMGSPHDFVLCGVRYYAPRYGRFLTWDPIGERGYGYCGNSATMAIDPTGRLVLVDDLLVGAAVCIAYVCIADICLIIAGECARTWPKDYGSGQRRRYLQRQSDERPMPWYKNPLSWCMSFCLAICNFQQIIPTDGPSCDSFCEAFCGGLGLPARSGLVQPK